MTVSSLTPVNNYSGNSSSTKFDFDFLIEDENELVVKHIDSTGVSTILEEGVDYSINEIGNKQGSYITFPLATSEFSVLKADERISIYLDLDIQQESEFKNSSYFNFNVLEWTFDYVVRILQVLNRKIERCVKVDEGVDVTPDELMDSINEAQRLTNEAAELSVSMKNECVLNKEATDSNVTYIDNKISTFNTTYEECLQDILDEGIETRANINLTNLSNDGEKHFLNKSNITDCILESPNGVVSASENVLTIKSGIKVLIPNGRNDDETLKNIEFSLANDITYTYTYTMYGLYWYVWLCSDSTIKILYKRDTYFQETTPTSSSYTNLMWYKPSDNLWRESTDGGSTWNVFYGARIAEFQCVGDGISDDIGTLISYKPVELLKSTDSYNIINEGIPDYTGGIDITNQFPYTAPSDGFINVSLNACAQTRELYINNVRVGYANSNLNTFVNLFTAQLRVVKGDVISSNISLFQWAAFYPTKGRNTRK